MRQHNFGDKVRRYVERRERQKGARFDVGTVVSQRFGATEVMNRISLPDGGAGTDLAALQGGGFESSERVIVAKWGPNANYSTVMGLVPPHRRGTEAAQSFTYDVTDVETV
jgi:hypothetical protein